MARKRHQFFPDTHGKVMGVWMQPRRRKFLAHSYLPEREDLWLMRRPFLFVSETYFVWKSSDVWRTTTFLWIKTDFVVRLLNFLNLVFMKNHMPSSSKKFNGLSTHFISRNVGTYFLLNVHNALLNVRYIVFTHTKRYQCAFVCTPIFCIITLSHYLRKIEYVVHSILEF